MFTHMFTRFFCASIVTLCVAGCSASPAKMAGASQDIVSTKVAFEKREKAGGNIMHLRCYEWEGSLDFLDDLGHPLSADQFAQIVRNIDNINGYCLTFLSGSEMTLANLNRILAAFDRGQGRKPLRLIIDTTEKF